MTPAIPERIGRYQIKEVIGTGAFGTVYRATDERLGADVAIKVLAENHSLDPDVRERFIEEGRRLRRVRSPHLLAVYDLGETERVQPYLVLEWADRGDLWDRVAEARRLGHDPGTEDARDVARVLADALDVLHRHHLVHRDIAPKNLLLCSIAPVAATPDPATAGRRGLPLILPDERLCLADLGLAKDLALASGLTVAAGTTGFAPPEQREPGSSVDHRADVWAASALIVWLALNRPPDDGGQWKRALRDAGWPAPATRVLARGLAARPGDRFPTSGTGSWRSSRRCCQPP